MPQRSYAQLIDYLFNVNRFGASKLGLQNIEKLCRLLGTPQHHFSTVHIAGTNGKGSVTTKIARALELAGYSVGCYTSPHIACFRERIQINGELISEEDVVELLSEIVDCAERHQIPATFFELTTALAFLHFARRKVEVAVLETGLGGRLDATNIVTPLLSVITSISIDHAEILGNSLDSIAYEKAGIIKPMVPVVLGPSADLPVIRDIAHTLKCDVLSVQGMLGHFDIENSALARAALERLAETLELSKRAIEEGVQALPPCRMEQVPQHVLQRMGCDYIDTDIILDVGHNPDAMKRLLEAVKVRFPSKEVYMVCGFSKGKDVHRCLAILQPYVKSFTLIQTDHERSIPVDNLKSIAIDAGIALTSIICCHGIQEALKTVCKLARENDGVVVVCGSFFIMGDVRTHLGYVEPQDALNLNERLLVSAIVE